METIKGKFSNLWKAKEVLYATCVYCSAQLPWKLIKDTEVLQSSCCGNIFLATPHYNRERFHICYKAIETNNVIFIY